MNETTLNNAMIWNEEQAAFDLFIITNTNDSVERSEHTRNYHRHMNNAAKCFAKLRELDDDR